MISTLARILDLGFSRIQFTPDLMPSDITGTDILQEDPVTRQRSFSFIRGPIFGNVVLADEINRTPPKTQAALLQAMQEYRVTAGGRTYELPSPFFVLATQNPIEQEGTYPLPEAQLDRFMFTIIVDYPSYEEELSIVATTTSAYNAELSTVLDAREILDLQGLVRRVPVSDEVASAAVRLARSTRPADPSATPLVREMVAWGAGPRASQYLTLGAKARAILHGRPAPSKDDVKACARAVLRHRVIVNFKAESEGIRSETVIDKLIEAV
jgi:MoxR-like ATPase